MFEEFRYWDEKLFLAELEARRGKFAELRRKVHQFPDASGDEYATRDRILSELGNPTWQGVAGTGAIVRVGPQTGPAIAIRADLDALPLLEETGASFAASNGFMHACGHDVHIAGAAALVSAASATSLPFGLVFIMQPREESYPSGALDVQQSGLLEEHDVRHVIGVHVHPRVTRGTIAVGAGAVNAACDEFEIVVNGRDGHAAYPHQSADSLVALAHIIVAAQTLVSRRVDPMSPAVVTFGEIAAGNASNAIPAMAMARGSIRSMNQKTRTLLSEELATLARSIASALGCEANVAVTNGEPVLENDPELVAEITGVLSSEAIAVRDAMRSCGSDDFAYYSERFPSAMIFVGVGEDNAGPALHSSKFLPADDSVDSVAHAFAAGYIAAARLLSAQQVERVEIEHNFQKPETTY